MLDATIELWELIAPAVFVVSTAVIAWVLFHR